ncbi:helix-turn-helix transcriptional regulator [Gordonia sp. ABSL49_1]|uniref:helix-turn-helix transcriptional regulator n=1 Tax=Gordonia sp. ABSL49_1 TaxID=2920941 RepID=UPI001F11705F|nr:helix-turn-helix transcriptional regulator [Gordonia sp. ABSL49_1]MCH5641426.1 helix-turn-helix domain-containing protein [Gordonia sp. ABSL49_1]
MGRRERTEVYFRERLKTERESREWSQSAMAKMLTDNGIPMHSTTIAKIEAGDRAVRIDEAAGIAKLFDVSVDWLLGLKERTEDDLVYPIRKVVEVSRRSQWRLAEYMGEVDAAFSGLDGLDFVGAEDLKAIGPEFYEHAYRAMNAIHAASQFEIPDSVTLGDQKADEHERRGRTFAASMNAAEDALGYDVWGSLNSYLDAAKTKKDDGGDETQ